MLVEHRKKLREIKQQEQEREKPELDEQWLVLMDEILEKALREDLSVKVTYYEEKRYKTIEGKIETSPNHHRQLMIANERGIKELSPDNIIDIEIIDRFRSD